MTPWFHKPVGRRTAGLLWLGILLVGVPAQAQGPMKLADSAAGKAFLAEQYDVAAREFEKLAASNPDNGLVMRFLAMSYDRLGLYEEAIRTFRQALEQTPDNVALLYHSGTTFYNARLVEDARQNFLRVLALAPESEYAQLARSYLDAMLQQRTVQQAPGAPRRLSLYFQVGFQQDDYRYAGPEGEGTVAAKSSQISEYLSVELALVRTAAWLLSAEYVAYGAQYLDDSPEQRDLWQTGPGLTLQYSHRFGCVPVVGTLKGFQQQVHYDGGPDYSVSYGGTAGLQLGLTGNSSTRIYYRYTDDDFEEDGFDPLYSSRDADNHAGGLQHTAYFFDRQVWLTLGAEYQWNNAEGSNFVSAGPNYQGLLSLPLLADVRLDLGYQYEDEEYPDFVGPVARETTRREWNAALWRWWGTRVMTRLNYSEADEESSLAVLSYERRYYGVSMAYVY